MTEALNPDRTEELRESLDSFHDLYEFWNIIADPNKKVSKDIGFIREVFEYMSERYGNIIKGSAEIFRDIDSLLTQCNHSEKIQQLMLDFRTSGAEDLNTLEKALLIEEEIPQTSTERGFDLEEGKKEKLDKIEAKLEANPLVKEIQKIFEEYQTNIDHGKDALTDPVKTTSKVRKFFNAIKVRVAWLAMGLIGGVGVTMAYNYYSDKDDKPVDVRPANTPDTSIDTVSPDTGNFHEAMQEMREADKSLKMRSILEENNVEILEESEEGYFKVLIQKGQSLDFFKEITGCTDSSLFNKINDNQYPKVGCEYKVPISALNKHKTDSN